MSIKASGQTRIFLCHAKEDKEKVEQLYSRLKREGFDPWLDSKNLLPGQEWEREIEEAIENSHFFITCLSKNSVTKQGFLNREITKGLKIWEEQPEGGIYLIPALLEECRIPKRLSHLQYVDVNNEEGWEKLLSALKTRDQNQAPEPALPEPETKNEIWKEPITGMEFSWIPPGSFMMGSENGRDNEKPVHLVTITKGFYLQTTEVTQGQWRAVMGEDPPELRFKDCGDDCPVEGVSWYDAQEFIKRLNEWEGSGKYRLPTEAEWEYACRAGSAGTYYFGDDGSKLGEYAWYRKNSGNKTHPAAQKKPNAWGLYDMLGNVWEWCQDWKDDYNKGDTSDPMGANGGTYKVLRGGSWVSLQDFARCAYRVRLNPHGRDSYVGFRCARTL